MGNFSKKISERIKHTNIKEGYCLICGAHGSLSFDHVPPQGSITITKVEQHLLSEVLGNPEIKIPGVKSNNGSKFKTICRNCNSLIGRDDDEIATVCKSLTERIKRDLYNPERIGNSISIQANTVRYCRAMVGHILSATTTDECRAEPIESEFFSPLKDFVLRKNDAIEETHDFYYWFYPHKFHISAKLYGFRNNGHFTTQSSLNFFPLAFLITPRGEGIYPAQASKISLNESQLKINLSFSNIQMSGFPFTPLKNDQVFIFANQQTTVSRPIKD